MFDHLDFLYLPSRDVGGELAYFVEQLGGECVFAIEAYGTRVAMVRLHPDPPAVLLAGHLEGEAPVLVYRVSSLEETIASLSERGVELGARFGIPHGPGVEIVSPGPQRVAIYELTRPHAPEHLAGRRDF